MSVSAESVRLDAEGMWVGLADGRVIGEPMAWFPRLRRADPATEISPFGLHWEAQYEDASVVRLFSG